MDDHLAAVVTYLGGPFSTTQAAECGVTEGQLRRAVLRGELASPHPGVFVDATLLRAASANPAARHRLAVTAALLTSTPDTVASHRSAVALRGWTQLEQIPERPQLLRPAVPGRTPSASDVKGVRVAALPPGHRCDVDGVASTSDSRTIVDVARELPFLNAVVTADSAFASSGRPADLADVVASCAGWPGIRRAREVIAFADPLAESALESVGRVRMREHDLPRPTLQQWITDGLDRCRVDFLWEEFRTIGEADGMVKYTTDAALRAEKLRQEWLEELGYEVVRFSWAQVMKPLLIPVTMARFRRAFERGRLSQTA